MTRLLTIAVLASLSSCSCSRGSAPVTVAAPVCDCEPKPVLTAVEPKAPSTVPATQPEPTVSSPHVTPLQVCESDGELPLEAARAFFDKGEFQKALSCAAQASALFPRDALAHTERANALAALGKNDEARLAFARALAVDPDSLDALMGAAQFYGVTLPSSRENDELGSLYAERGLDIARSQHEDDTAIQFGRMSAMAFNDLGQPADALERADWVLTKKRDDPDARYERAFALFELCRFDDAKLAFSTLLNDPDRKGHVHQHLGLLAEREGKTAEAQKHFAAARASSAEDFPEPVQMTEAEFKSQVKAAIEALPVDMKKDVTGIPIEAEDLPSTDDLVAVDPPLSPTILGLFRGPPLDEPCTPDPTMKAGSPCRSVVLYRKNLGRAVHTRDELIEQIRVTLLHEIGHLRGEDDHELAARGLE